MTVRVAAYVHIRRSRLDLNPTGVGKHINAMVPGLAALPDFNVSVLGAREDLDEYGQLPTTSTLRGLPFKAFGGKRRFVEASWTLLRWPKAERWTGAIDWVYCPAEAYVATKAAKLAVTVHCVNWFEKELPWYDHADTRRQARGLKPRFQRYRTNTDLLLPVSEFLAGRLTTLFGIPRERMRIVGNGVEDAYYSTGPLDARWKAALGDRPYVIVIGGLTRRKGAECILDTAHELKSRRSNIRIAIAGTGEPQFDEQARQLDNIVMLGYVGVESGLPALLQSSVALLFPSRYETFGIPAVEAMAAGTPAVVSHFAGLPEVVGDAGVVMDPSQPAGIADAIINLERDGQLRNRFVELGRARAEQFRWSVCVRRLADALREFT